MYGCRTFHIVGLALLAGSCQTPPKPLALPTAILAVDYVTGFPGATTEQAPSERTVLLFAVKAAPTGTPASLAAAAIVRDRGEPFRGKSKLPIGSRWLSADDVRLWLADRNTRKPSQQQLLGEVTAVLGSALETTVQQAPAQGADDSVLPKVRMHWSDAGYRVVLVSGAPEDPERESLVVAAPFGDDDQVGLFVPDPRIEAGGLLLLLLPAGPATAAALAAAHEIANAKMAPPTDAAAIPRNWKLANQAVGEHNRRPALLAVVTPLALHRVTDLLLAADEPALIAIGTELSRLDPNAENLAWLVEAAAWRALVPRAERDELSPALRAAFARHLGGPADDGATLRLLVRIARHSDQFADALIDENLAALNDRSAAVRVRAVSWLHDRDIQIDNYDPMGSKVDRRGAVRRYLAAQESGR